MAHTALMRACKVSGLGTNRFSDLNQNFSSYHMPYLSWNIHELSRIVNRYDCQNTCSSNFMFRTWSVSVLRWTRRDIFILIFSHKYRRRSWGDNAFGSVRLFVYEIIHCSHHYWFYEWIYMYKNVTSGPSYCANILRSCEYTLFVSERLATTGLLRPCFDMIHQRTQPLKTSGKKILSWLHYLGIVLTVFGYYSS